MTMYTTLLQVVVDSDIEEDKVWIVYDAGPKSVRCPIVFLPPASGTADVFFKQLVALSSIGYRVMSVSRNFIVAVKVISPRPVKVTPCWCAAGIVGIFLREMFSYCRTLTIVSLE